MKLVPFSRTLLVEKSKQPRPGESQAVGPTYGLRVKPI